MTMKYHILTPQTNLQHREEETQGINITKNSERQLMKGSRLLVRQNLGEF